MGASARDAGVVTIAKDDPVDTERLARARQAIADRLLARGKHVDVSVDVVTDAATPFVDVVITAG
jgi:hypothetical protein